MLYAKGSSWKLKMFLTLAGEKAGSVSSYTGANPTACAPTGRW